MSHAQLRREIAIDAPAGRVWQFIATEEGLRQWWGSGISLEPRQGGRCAEEIHIQGTVHHLRGIVTVYDPPSRLTMTLRPEQNPGDLPAITTISIILQQEAHQTRVTVVHEAVSSETITDVIRVGMPAIPPAFNYPQMSLQQAGSRHSRMSNTATSGRTGSDPNVAAHQTAIVSIRVQNEMLWARRLVALRAALLA